MERNTKEVLSRSLNLIQVHSWSTIKFENKSLRSIGHTYGTHCPKTLCKHYIYKLAICNSKILWKSGQVLHVNAIFTAVKNLLQNLIGIVWSLTYFQFKFKLHCIVPISSWRLQGSHYSLADIDFPITTFLRELLFLWGPIF